MSKGAGQLSELHDREQIRVHKENKILCRYDDVCIRYGRKIYGLVFRNINKKGQGVGVIMQESVLLTGMEFQYMCLAIRSQ